MFKRDNQISLKVVYKDEKFKRIYLAFETKDEMSGWIDTIKHYVD